MAWSPSRATVYPKKTPSGEKMVSPMSNSDQAKPVRIAGATPDLADVPVELLAHRRQRAAQPAHRVGLGGEDLPDAVLHGQPPLGGGGLGHVPREALGMQDAVALAPHVRGDARVLDGAVGAAQARLEVAQRLAATQPFDKDGADPAVGVELGDVVADVVLGPVAQHGELGAVGVEDVTGRANEVDRHGRVVEELLEGLGGVLHRHDGPSIGMTGHHRKHDRAGAEKTFSQPAGFSYGRRKRIPPTNDSAVELVSLESMARETAAGVSGEAP